MDGLRVIPLIAILIALSWFILTEIIVFTHNDIGAHHLQCSVPPNTFVMKAENDTTNYTSLNNSECFCEKVNCAKKCYQEDVIKDHTQFSLLFPFYITENITHRSLCKSQMTPLLFNIDGAHIRNGFLVIEGDKTEHFCVINSTYFFICADIEPTDSYHIIIGK